ncbi:MAG: hypothetical protein E5X53_28260 [Mesorhizobium sp.]|uniref:hypothetical protein n=1 Tax=Mesorhizobium sp. TaxID=1871066 RepID=UPI00121260B2|nr:hypothetical protein [Mesorhizobium sp.]TIP70343.1 MAG: hypothetical protein E5X55_27890 [Mesorhizobium sp.]TIQ06740.1 MAG: hypothetical protein E5X57_24110 [Mesorhizobium sp.]TIR48619.1 MAG: hypothetical protein E5X53_28260 [Mesorhizobium sp.]TJV94692.1 MAG: hypothetical protein E5X52_27875 [Mesorhizobium sp.]
MKSVLAISGFAALALSNPAFAAEWTVGSDTNPIDDSVTVSASIDSNEIIPGDTEKSLLMIGCLKGEPSVFIYTGRDIQYPEAVDYRVDKNPAEKIGASNFKGNLVIEGPNVEPFLRRISAGKDLVVQAIPYSGPMVTVSFSLEGFAKAVEPVATACKIRGLGK